MVVSPVRRSHETFSHILGAEISTSNNLFEFPENPDSVSVSTNSDPEILVEEWANDSRLLLADAFVVRRLLRLTLQGFCLYHDMVNHIRDDVFIAESRVNNRLLLCALVIWLKYMDRVRIEAERSRLVGSYVARNLQQRSLKLWARTQYISHSISRFQQTSVRRRASTSLQTWYSQTVPFVNPRRTIVARVDKRLLRGFLDEWRKERTMIHLDYLHRSQMMDRFHLNSVFNKLKENKARKSRKHIAEFFSRRSRSNRVMTAFKIFFRDRKSARDKLLSSENCLVGYMVQKFALMSDNMSKNTSVFAKTESFILASICHVVLEKWRTRVINESVGRARANFEAVSKAVRGWKRHVEVVRILRDRVNTLLGKTPKKLTRKFFNLWNFRLEKRQQFRENLSDFATRTIVSSELPVFRGWHSVVKSEKRMREISAKILKKNLGKKFFKLWISTARFKHQQTVLDEISRLYERKIASKRVLDILSKNRIRCFKKRDLENIAERFTNKLAINRWRIVLVTRYAWRSAFAFVHNQCERGRLRRAFREWIRLIHLGIFWDKKLNEKREILRRKILIVFQLNATHEMYKRKSEAVSRKFQQKIAIRNLARYVENKKIFAKYLSWRILREFFARWVLARLVQARVECLSRVVEKGMLRIALYQFAVWNTDRRELEKFAVEKIMVKNIKNIFLEWNLLGKFNRFNQVRVSRKSADEAVDRRNLVEKHFRLIVHNFRQIRGLRSLCNRQETRLKRTVFGVRRSSWRQAVAESKLHKLVLENKLSCYFGEWEKQTHIVKIHEIELELNLEKFKKKSLRVIFSNWYFGVTNRQFLQMNILINWHQAVSEINRKREVVHEIYLRYIRILLGSCFGYWVERCRSRAELRDRVFSISSNYLQNKMRIIFLGFFKNMTLRKNFRIIREKIVRQHMIRIIDKWVNGTVTVISIRESMCRIVSKIAPKIDLVYALTELKENARIAKIFIDKEAFLVSSDDRRARTVRRAFFIEWAETTRRNAIEREGVCWMLKRVGLDRLQNFIISQRERGLMENLADEFLVAKETEKMTSLIGLALVGWKELVDYERLIGEKTEILSKFKRGEILLRFLTEWKYQLEVKLYEKDLGEKETDLKSRVLFRKKTKIFNQLILLFLDQTEVAKIGIDFHRFLLERRVVSVLKRHSELGRKTKALRNWTETKRVRLCFDSMFKEVYLTFKERIAYRRILCISALRKLTQYTQYRKDRAMMKLFGKWKRDNEDRNNNEESDQSLSRVFGSWKAVVEDTNGQRTRTHAEPMSRKSYREIRSRSVTPSSVEVSRIESNNDTSYRKMRNRE